MSRPRSRRVDCKPRKPQRINMLNESHRRTIWPLLVLVLLLFLFHVPFGTGTFQAVNGPTTVFTAYRAAQALLLLISALASAVGRFSLSSPACFRQSAEAPDFASLSPLAQVVSSLRC